MVVERQIENADLDASMVVHFAKYPVFMETAVLTTLEQHAAGILQFNQQQKDLMVHKLEVDYRLPCRYLESIALSVDLLHLGKSRLVFEVTIAHQGTLRTRGQLHFVCVDKKTLSLSKIPEPLFTILEKWHGNSAR